MEQKFQACVAKTAPMFPQTKYLLVVGEIDSAVAYILRVIDWYPQAFHCFAQVRMACKALQEDRTNESCPVLGAFLLSV